MDQQRLVMQSAFLKFEIGHLLAGVGIMILANGRTIEAG